MSVQQPDLDARLADIEQSISSRKRALRKEERRLGALRERKAFLDSDLSRRCATTILHFCHRFES